MIVAGVRHCEAESALINEYFTLSKSVQSMLVAIGKFVMGFYNKSAIELLICRLKQDTSLETIWLIPGLLQSLKCY